MEYAEKDEVIEILQHHPEYKGYELGISIDDILEKISIILNINFHYG